jgi:glyoxylase-like metal-dependent hydrolase (beta-lactamase superfamily II)
VDHYLELLKQKGLRLRYTLETHTHADHLSGSMRLKELTGAMMLMHAASPAPCVDRRLQDGETVELGRLRLEVMATPGHTQDGLCLVLPGRVLTGDTLLIGACGRADLPTGSAARLYESLQRLMGLPEELVVMPAHDYHRPGEAHQPAAAGGQRAGVRGDDGRAQAAPAAEAARGPRRQPELPLSEEPLSLQERDGVRVPRAER